MVLRGNRPVQISTGAMDPNKWLTSWPQAIMWTNVDQDLSRYMASLGHNESI